MPYDVKWLIEDYVILERFWGVFTADEVAAADACVITLIEHSPQATVHAIIDDTQIIQMPPITALGKIKSAQHPKLGWSIIFGNKRQGLHFVTLLANNILRFQLRFAPTCDSALNKLYELDPNIPQSQYSCDEPNALI